MDAIIGCIPQHGRGTSVLSFCFLDPSKRGNLHFDTIRGLARRYMDFLVLIPVQMDAKRAWKHYLREDNDTVDRFLGTRDWRDEWKQAEARRETIDAFLTSFFHRQMQALEYTHGGIHETVLVHIPGKNVPLYRLGFFSRNELGGKFWKQAKSSSLSQTDFLDELTEER